MEAVASGVQSHPQIHKELGGYPGLHKTLSQKKEEVGNIAYLVERLPGMERVLGLTPQHHKLGMGAARTCLKQTNNTFLKDATGKYPSLTGFCDDAVAQCARQAGSS